MPFTITSGIKSSKINYYKINIFMGKFLQNLFAFSSREEQRKKTEEKITEKSEKYVAYRISDAQLPRSYYAKGQQAIGPFVRILTEPLGLSQKIYHHPTGRQFFNEVEGFVINDKLTVLRYYGRGIYPGNCKQLAKIFGGRLPTGEEMREISRNLDRICVSLSAIGEGTLYKGNYLITDDPGSYEALVMDIEEPDKIEPVDFDEPCNFIVVK